MDVLTIDNFDPVTGYAAAPDDTSVALQELSHAPAGGRYRLGFALFVLVNAALFVRPADIVEAWENLPIYQFLIIGCLLVSLPVVIPQLKWSSLKRNPITLCVLGLLPAIVLSHLSHGETWYAKAGGIEFVKVILYYLLLMGLIDSPARLRRFLMIFVGFVFCITVLCLLNHHEVINIPALADLKEGYDPELLPFEQGVVLIRVRAMGIFNDPNDLCLILNAASFICLHWLIENKNLLVRLWLAALIGTMLYCLALTQSRGGFLSLLVGVVVLMFSRMSKARAVLISAIVLPAILAIFAGRITNIDINDTNDTGQGRIQLWRESLIVFHRMPLFGLGEGKILEEIGNVSHNSYVHGYAELGFFGGTLFIGLFYIVVIGLMRLSPNRAPYLSQELRSLRLCILPVIAAYMMGIYSLSRNYVLANYLFVGFVAVLLSLAGAAGNEVPVLSGRLARNILLASIGCVFYFEVFVRIFAR